MKKSNALVNAAIRFIQTHDVPGKYRLYEATKHGCRDTLITYHINGHDFSIPWDQWCFWKNYGPENYYLDEIQPFAQVLNEQLTTFDFFDLGADVGVVSMLVNKYCRDLSTIIALEPNPSSFSVLAENIRNLGDRHHRVNKAISDFDGRCHFSFNQQQGSDHEGHLTTDKIGNTEVVSLDSLVQQLMTEQSFILRDDIALKIDVEGQELATINGAAKTIHQAKKVVMLLELHPEVLDRDGQTAEDIFNAAEAIRPFKWLVPLDNNKCVDRTRPFFAQFPRQQYDIIGIAIE